MTQYHDYNGKLEVKDLLFTPLYGVKLKEGLWKDAFDRNRAYLKKLSMDGMLYWFNKKAGSMVPGRPYTGHFEDNIKGQTAALFLMGAGNSLRWMEDEELRQKLDAIMDGIEGAAEPDGFILPIEKKEFPTREYPHYVRIWMNYGLAAAALAGREGALRLLRLWTDWFNRSKELPIIKYLNLAFQGVVASTFVYTTPVGIPEDIRITQEYYEEPWRLAQFIFREKDAVHIRKQPGHEPHAHGSELEAFEGYLDLYRVTGAYYYLNAVEGVVELYRRDWQHPGGGIVMCEFAAAYPGCNWIRGDVRYNELCCTAFWMGIHQRFHRMFPDVESHVAEVEKSLYNIAIADQDGEDGIRYFALLEGKKQEGGQIHCCCGVGTKILGSLPEYIYSIAPDCVSVDHYAASEMVWERPQGPVTLALDTQMPYDGAVRLRLSMAEPQQFTLRLRVPGWCGRAVSVALNGAAYAQGEGGTYLVIHRVWQEGDVLTLDLPMAFRYAKYSGGDEVEGYDRYSFEYGPLLYALCGPLDDAGLIPVPFADPQGFLRALKPIGDLLFEVKGMPGFVFMPYFAVPEETFTAFPVFSEESP